MILELICDISDLNLSKIQLGAYNPRQYILRSSLLVRHQRHLGLCKENLSANAHAQNPLKLLQTLVYYFRPTLILCCQDWSTVKATTSMPSIKKCCYILIFFLQWYFISPARRGRRILIAAGFCQAPSVRHQSSCFFVNAKTSGQIFFKF